MEKVVFVSSSYDIDDNCDRENTAEDAGGQHEHDIPLFVR
jgi:hypothetical protein